MSWRHSPGGCLPARQGGSVPWLGGGGGLHRGGGLKRGDWYERERQTPPDQGGITVLPCLIGGGLKRSEGRTPAGRLGDRCARGRGSRCTLGRAGGQGERIGWSLRSAGPGERGSGRASHGRDRAGEARVRGSPQGTAG